jgi:putative DNA primase/helicase
MKVKFNRERLSDADFAKERQLIAKEQKAIQAKKLAREDVAAVRAMVAFNKGLIATKAFPYLKNKGVDVWGEMVETRLPTQGVDFIQTMLLLPLRDIHGKIHSAQTIDTDGNKRFFPGGKVVGCFYAVNRHLGSPIVICEGYATGATIAEATGWTVIAAMNCGNLLPVAKSFRELLPSRAIIIAADDDERLLSPDEPHKERGLTKAKKAAHAVGGFVTVPVFPKDDKSGTDFNDMARVSGIDAVAKIFNS